jgi:hypothetical protein
MYKLLKTLHPGGIRTRDLLFWRRTRWALCQHIYINTYVSCTCICTYVCCLCCISPRKFSRSTAWRKNSPDRQRDAKIPPIYSVTQKFPRSTAWRKRAENRHPVKSKGRLSAGPDEVTGNALWNQIMRFLRLSGKAELYTEGLSGVSWPRHGWEYTRQG